MPCQLLFCKRGVVAHFLTAEVQEGWIRPVPGGLPALKSSYKQSAVGKLGVVLAEGRFAPSGG